MLLSSEGYIFFSCVYLTYTEERFKPDLLLKKKKKTEEKMNKSMKSQDKMVNSS